MKIAVTLFLLCWILFASTGFAQHQRLQGLYSDSDLVIGVEVTREPVGFMGTGPIDVPNVEKIYYWSVSPTVKIIETFKAPKGFQSNSPFEPIIHIPISDKHPPDLSDIFPKSSKWIMFLDDSKKHNVTYGSDGKPHYESVDYWFSFIPLTPALVLQLSQMKKTEQGAAANP